MADWLTLAGSLRYDHHSRFDGALSPRLSVLGQVGGWVARLSAGTGYFPSTPFTEETQAVGLRRLTEPGDWKKERARTGMIDIGRKLGPVEVSASAFTSTIRDPLERVRNGDGTLTIRNSGGPVRTWGTEVFAAFHRGGWHLVGSHTFLRSTEADPSGSGRREVPLTPQHAVGMVGAYEPEWGRIGVEAYFTGRQELDDDPYRTASRSHLILGFLVDRRF